VVNARQFWNPGDSDPAPTEITNSELDTPQSAHISFDFPVGGQGWWDFEPDTVLLRDNSPTNNEGFGVFEITAAFEVHFVPTCPGDVTGDGRVRQRDLRLVLRNRGLLEHAVFRDGDADGDGNVDSSDLVIVLENLGQHCE
ncbi:MAG: dockerin type I repeat-containing protein, partial [Planctomycetota bacterium]